MKTYLFILLLLLLVGGRSQTKRFDNNFFIGDFKYSTYKWQLKDNPNGNSYEWEFYLLTYLHIDTSGNFQLIRHPYYRSNTEFLKGDISDSVRQTIDLILQKNQYFSEINTSGILADTVLIIYDGFTYLLDYQPIETNKRTRIQYINTSSKTPENILFLTSFLDTFAFNTHINKTDSFSIGAYLDTLKKISSYSLPPLPLSPPINPKIKF